MLPNGSLIGCLLRPAMASGSPGCGSTLARYAEDQAHIVGKDESLYYPNAYFYRDWVIGALNSDLPYDRFRAASTGC